MTKVQNTKSIMTEKYCRLFPGILLGCYQNEEGECTRIEDLTVIKKGFVRKVLQVNIVKQKPSEATLLEKSHCEAIMLLQSKTEQYR